MLCSEIIKKLEESYPGCYAMEWDNIGLQIGRREKEVQKIYVALDATDEVVEEAAGWGADMLITHHPMIFKALKSVTDDDFIGRRALKLIRHDISYYAMHTNYDVKGMANLAGDRLQMKDAQVLEVTKEGENGELEGLGRISDLEEPTILKECCRLVKQCFTLPSVKVFGEPHMLVQRIAVCPGSGKSVIRTAIAKGADVLITGDIDHHEGIDAVAQGMAVIDAGHYGIEHIFIADMEKTLKEVFPELTIRSAQIRHPFWIM